MNKFYCCFIFLALFIFCFSENIVAQKKLKGVCTNKTISDSVFNFIYSRDTVNDGSFVTKYKITNAVGFSEINIVHLQSEQRIEISFLSAKGSSPQKKIIKYESNGGFIFVDGTDTVQYETGKKYRSVLFFDSEQKEGYVFLNQFTALNDEVPEIFLSLDPISSDQIKENKSKVDYYLLKGTPERRAVYKRHTDSLNHEKLVKWQADSIALGARASYAYKQVSFLQKRDSTVLNGGIPLTNEYLDITRKVIGKIIDSSLQNIEGGYFKTYCKFLVDTSGILENLEYGNINSDLVNSRAVSRELKSLLSKKKLKTMMMYDDSGVAYTMATRIQFPVSFEMKTIKIQSFIYKHTEPKLINFTFNDNHYRTELTDSLKKMKRGKYRMTIDYRNILNDTTYTISKLKNVSDKNYLKIGCSFGTLLSQFGNNPVDYKGDLNFPYLNFSVQYHFGGLFFASDFIPVFGKDLDGIAACDLTIQNPISQTYNSDMKYSEFGIYLSPAHLVYMKIGMASQKNISIISEYTINNTSQFCTEKIADSNGYVLGVAFAPKYFTLEAGFNTLIHKPFVNLGFNIPISIKI